jgi:hypothetical protein
MIDDYYSKIIQHHCEAIFLPPKLIQYSNCAFLFRFGKSLPVVLESDDDKIVTSNKALVFRFPLSNYLFLRYVC